MKRAEIKISDKYGMTKREQKFWFGVNLMLSGAVVFIIFLCLELFLKDSILNAGIVSGAAVAFLGYALMIWAFFEVEKERRK